MTREFWVFVSGIKMSRRKHTHTCIYICIDTPKENPSKESIINEY